MSLTDKSQLATTEELSIRIKADKENHVLHITDTGAAPYLLLLSHLLLLLLFYLLLLLLFYLLPQVLV